MIKTMIVTYTNDPQGTAIAVIGFLGILMSSSVIAFLSRRRIRLANSKSLLIINVASSDVVVSFLGFLRGLGILDGKFVGAPDEENTSTSYCVAYALCLNSLARSGMLALLPLTIDRAMAILLPLKYKVVMTRRVCCFMFAAVWCPIFLSLLHSLLSYGLGLRDITVEYDQRYHRCMVSGGYEKIDEFEEVCLVIVPFFVIFVMYLAMLFFIVKNRIRSGRFLVTASGIVLTGLISYFPSLIANVWDIPMSYEESQLLTITLYYINGIVNPIIYVATHPATKQFVNDWLGKMRSEDKSVAEQGSQPNRKNDQKKFRGSRPSIVVPLESNSVV